jgi:hypothetical protein
MRARKVSDTIMYPVRAEGVSDVRYRKVLVLVSQDFWYLFHMISKKDEQFQIIIIIII